MRITGTVVFRITGLITLWWGVGFEVQPASAEEARLLRFPAIHGDQLVFGYAGDLFTVSAQGGLARRLTSDVGYEMFPRFSPDGKWVAFTGQYDGNTEVYLIPAEGGVPKRLTYTATLERDDVSDRMGPNNIVLTWRDAQTIVFRGKGKEWNPFKGRLCTVSPEGGPTSELPLPRGGWCSFSPDQKLLSYNRVFREFRTWKRYRGGQADEIWIYDFEQKTTQKITDNPAQDVFPMWYRDTIYFASDRDENRRMNLFAYNTKTKTTRPVTQFTEFDVKFPSIGDKAIVFENGGWIYRLDLETEAAVKVPIEIHEDFAVGRGKLLDVSKATTGFEIASDGSRALVGARGDIFTIPAKHGPTRNLTQTPGVHEREAVWSPDGRFIAYIADETGEDEIYLRPQNGIGAVTRLTAQGDTYKYALEWSPDAKRLLWSDKRNRLQMVEVASKEVTLVDQSPIWEIRQYTWSPDSQWIAYVRPEQRRFPNIHLYSLQSREQIQVTDGWFDVSTPEFSSDGKYLFFVSERTFNPHYGQTEFNHIYTDMDRIYLITLAKETKSPFAPKSDEVKVTADAEAKPVVPPDNKEIKKEDGAEKKDASTDDAKEKKEPAKKEKVNLKVESEGIQQRVAAFPIPASSYSHLSSVGDKLYYIRKGKLYLYDLEKEKETELADCGSFRISANRKKMLISSGGSHAIIDLPTSKAELKDKLDLGDLKVQLDRRAEWNQIFAECWRQMRDFVYDPHLHGVDWAAIRRLYEPLLPFVQHRADLTYIIGEMIGELNLGHCYVGGGDYPKAERIAVGLLGATVKRHPSGFYEITEILPGQNWDSSLRSPLTEIGVNVKVGEFIVAVDGKPADQLPDLYAALLGKAEKQVLLRVNGSPGVDGARDEVVRPISDEQELYYLKWIRGNIEKVSRATDGRVGYVHIRDMQARGLNDFVKFYYPQLYKQGLIVDVRGNGGGNVSSQIIERLRREPTFWTIARNGAVDVDPGGMVLGPKVLLLDQFSASDGDIVAYRFKKHHLGPVIGQRSWGGVVGIRGSLPLLDGGYLNRPEFSRFDLETREWVMEGKGVDPDIAVDNDPAHEFSGVDDQLNRAIDEIKAALAKSPVHLPDVPAYPDKRH